MQIKRPGLRIIKTFIALTLSMLVSHLRPGESMPFYSGIAAVICLQQNLAGTRDVGINRMIGTIIGGLLGTLYLLIVPINTLPFWIEIILISFVTTFFMWMMVVAKKPAALSIMAIVFLSVTLNHGLDPKPVLFAIQRTIDTLIGVVAAIGVNWVDFALRGEDDKSSIKGK